MTFYVCTNTRNDDGRSCCRRSTWTVSAGYIATSVREWRGSIVGGAAVVSRPAAWSIDTSANSSVPWPTGSRCGRRWWSPWSPWSLSWSPPPGSPADRTSDGGRPRTTRSARGPRPTTRTCTRARCAVPSGGQSTVLRPAPLAGRPANVQRNSGRKHGGHGAAALKDITYWFIKLYFKNVIFTFFFPT